MYESAEASGALRCATGQVGGSLYLSRSPHRRVGLRSYKSFRAQPLQYQAGWTQSPHALRSAIAAMGGSLKPVSPRPQALPNADQAVAFTELGKGRIWGMWEQAPMKSIYRSLTPASVN